MIAPRHRVSALLALGLSMASPAGAFQDGGGWFSRSVVSPAPVPSPSGPAEDEVVYVASRGNSVFGLDGSVWAFWKQPRCIDPEAESPDPIVGAPCNPSENDHDPCSEGVCSALWWVFSGAEEDPERTNRTINKGKIYSYPVLSGDGETVYITSENHFVYALPARPPEDCIIYEYPGPRTKDQEKGAEKHYERIPKLDRKCIKWQFDTQAKLRASVAVDPTPRSGSGSDPVRGGRVYVGTQSS